MRILLITPPLIQINTPYPATPYLTSFLRHSGYEVMQKDLSLDFLLRIFSKSGLKKVLSKEKALHRYLPSIDSVIQFLQGQNPKLASKINNRKYLPEGSRFREIRKHPVRLRLISEMSKLEQAKFWATNYLLEVVDLIRLNVDEDFHFARYNEKLASSATSFTPLYKKLKGRETTLDKILNDLIAEYVDEVQPDFVGITLPFPGNVYGALKSAQTLKKINPKIKIAMGGGFVNTELRSLSDKRIFEFTDFLIFDDGFRPILQLIECLRGKVAPAELLRTWYLEGDEIQKVNSPRVHDIPFRDTPAPTYEGLGLKNYLSLIDMPNPMTRLWSEFRWNKLVLAHGCYWKKCTFCDVTLDYINRFEPQKATKLVDQMEKLIQETGFNGFHFVDEAAPPALLKQLSQEIIARKLEVSWWGNIRFDKQFDLETARLMSKAGCIAVTGGLEVASPRVLALINKGVTVEQVARVTKNFTENGIYVHAYLIYGFPSETTQETIDSLEVVRQLFKNECIDSGFWHRFTATAHSPVGQAPEKYGIKLKPDKIPRDGLFALNGIEFIDAVKTPHDKLASGLEMAIYNYMHGMGWEADVREWFTFKVPKPSLPIDFVTSVLSK
jgi:hypothetical protein